MKRKIPYKLFDYYTEADVDVFFGRESEVSAVVGDILANKLLVLFARSGSGKTSLLNAGIGPALHDVGGVDEDDPGIQMVTVRLSGDMTPEESSLAALCRTLDSDGPTESETLHDFLRRRSAVSEPGKPGRQPLGLVLVFDQFEELFITLFRDRPSVRREFAAQLAKIIYDDSLRVYVVLSLRSDYFHHLNEFRTVIPSIFQNNTNLELRAFDDAAAIRVICGPAALEGSGFTWQEGLPQKIVGDLKGLNDDRDGILPIHLQIVCYGLWERLPQDEVKITVAHYESVTDGATGASPAAAMVHQRIIVPLEKVKGRERQRWLYRLLRELMTRHGTKAPRPLSALRKVVPEKYLTPLLNHLEEKLLLRREDAEQETWYELRHDYLSSTITEWLGPKEQALKERDRWRRNVLIAILVVFVALATVLIGEWNSYTAFIGWDEKRPDELIIKRHAAFGMWSPPWWNREIDTGFVRSQLLSGGVPKDSFPLERALSDWKEVEPQLSTQNRLAIQLATRLAPPSAQAPSARTEFFDLVGHYDVALYSATDERVLRHVINVSQFGNRDVKLSAVSALGSLGKNLPADRANDTVNALLQALKDQDSVVKRSAASALGDLGKNLPADRSSGVINALLQALKGQDSDVKSSAASALGGLGKNLPTDRSKDVINALLQALKDEDSVVKRSAASALGGLGKNLPTDRSKDVINALLQALKDEDSVVKRSAAFALGGLGKNLPTDRSKDVINALLQALKDEDSVVKPYAAFALGSLGKNLPADRSNDVINALLPALKDQNSDVKRSAASALGYLGENLPADRSNDVINALLPALKDQNSDVKSSAASVLGSLGKDLPADRSGDVINALLQALKDQDSFVKSSAASALGSLGKNLPADRSGDVINALLQALKVKDQDYDFMGSYVKRSVASALGSLGKNLPGDAINALLQALKDQDSDVKSLAASALGNLGENLPADCSKDVINALLQALKDQDSDVKSLAASALGNLGENLPADRSKDVINALLQSLKDQDSAVKRSAASALAEIGLQIEPKRPSSVFLDLDPLPSTADEQTREVLNAALRKLASADWTQSDRELLGYLESDDSRWRVFALHVLARRTALSDETLNRIGVLRDDPRGRPWVKTAALRCLVEIEREKRARELDAQKKREAQSDSKTSGTPAPDDAP